MWSLVFDLVVRLLHVPSFADRSMRSRCLPTILCGYIGPPLFVALPLLLQVFALLSVAAGLAVNYAKTLVINYSGQSNFTAKRRLVDATGIAQIGVARVGVHLGVLIGP